MKTSIALKRTKKLVWDGIGSDAGKHTYICHAANDAGFGPIVRPVVLLLLAPHNSLESWLRENAPIKYKALSNFEKKIQATRHAWLDHLIAHYESIGD